MAHWIIEDASFAGHYYTCSNCRHVWSDIFNDVASVYSCPNCGEPILDKWIDESEMAYRYMLLDRLKQDCIYYLSYGNRSKKALWAESEDVQIRQMKSIWNSFPEDDKPEWLTWEEIEDFAQKMGVLDI